MDNSQKASYNAGVTKGQTQVYILDLSLIYQLAS